jgi:hypothetical protein
MVKLVKHMNDIDRIKIFFTWKAAWLHFKSWQKNRGTFRRSVGIERNSAVNNKEWGKISSEVKQVCSLANVLQHLVDPSFLIWRSEVISVITNMNISCPVISISIRTSEVVCCMPVRLVMSAGYWPICAFFRSKGFARFWLEKCAGWRWHRA